MGTRARTSASQDLVRQELGNFDASNTLLSKVQDSNTVPPFIMPREAELSLNERAFVLEALKEDIRLDGRSLDALRDVEIAFGDEYGTADVKMGKTRYGMEGVQRGVEAH